MNLIVTLVNPGENFGKIDETCLSIPRPQKHLGKNTWEEAASFELVQVEQSREFH